MLTSTGDMVTVLAKGDFQPKPNGIAILRDGGWLLTHLGDTDGGVFRLMPDGELTPFLTSVDGIDLPPTNYVHVDGQGRTWVTVSTRLQPRDLGYRADCSDGFIVLVDDAGARIVAVHSCGNGNGKPKKKKKDSPPIIYTTTQYTIHNGRRREYEKSFSTFFLFIIIIILCFLS